MGGDDGEFAGQAYVAEAIGAIGADFEVEHPVVADLLNILQGEAGMGKYLAQGRRDRGRNQRIVRAIGAIFSLRGPFLGVFALTDDPVIIDRNR